MTVSGVSGLQVRGRLTMYFFPMVDFAGDLRPAFSLLLLVV